MIRVDDQGIPETPDLFIGAFDGEDIAWFVIVLFRLNLTGHARVFEKRRLENFKHIGIGRRDGHGLHILLVDLPRHSQTAGSHLGIGLDFPFHTQNQAAVVRIAACHPDAFSQCTSTETFRFHLNLDRSLASGRDVFRI